MTPGVQTFVGTTPIVALATPLPVIFPTAIAGAMRYRAAGQIDLGAARWLILAGAPAAIAGAAATDHIATETLLLITALLLGWQAIGIIRGSDVPGEGPTIGGPGRILATGAAAGFVSGLLGIGGGLLMVPLLTRWIGMPLKRSLGTSLAAIVGMVIPGTIVHAWLGNIDWSVALALAIGSVPGARIGSRIALGTKERTLRRLVGTFMLVVALAYAAQQVRDLMAG
jgi:uncharacterized membrane protein YfcA